MKIFIIKNKSVKNKIRILKFLKIETDGMKVAIQIENNVTKISVRN